MFKSAVLNEILAAELGHNNEIAENTQWLPQCEKLIILAYKFSRAYDGASYRELNDNHYWFAEYIDGNECLACKFKTHSKP
ncbi:hypothetical protein [Shewanella sp.]|uniref:hypothetical protein n=1 Tax=Shewanella sp. TaxID=50422 RepID=UPI003A9842B6